MTAERSGACENQPVVVIHLPDAIAQLTGNEKAVPPEYSPKSPPKDSHAIAGQAANTPDDELR